MVLEPEADAFPVQLDPILGHTSQQRTGLGCATLGAESREGRPSQER
jgi:hypothetical protein